MIKIFRKTQEKLTKQRYLLSPADAALPIVEEIEMELRLSL